MKQQIQIQQNASWMVIYRPTHEGSGIARSLHDFIAWNLTNTGIFLVRLAYHIEWNRQFGSRMKVSNGMGATVDNPIWKTLWTKRCPSKIKINVWRTLNGALPCRAVLADRHIKTLHNAQLATYAPRP